MWNNTEFRMLSILGHLEKEVKYEKKIKMHSGRLHELYNLDAPDELLFAEITNLQNSIEEMKKEREIISKLCSQLYMKGE